jgi:hypothetical protein
MPTTPIDRLENPLRQLRVALGDFGLPLSQDAFARRIGVPYATVQSIENGRRELNEGCLLRIKTNLFAVWNRADKAWYPLWSGGNKTPYSKEDAFTAARLHRMHDPELEKLDLYMLAHRLKVIYEALPDAGRLAGVMNLHRILAEYARAEGIDPTLLESTEPCWMFSKQLWGQPLTEAIMYAKYPSCDPKDRLEFSPEWAFSVPLAQKETRENERTLGAPPVQGVRKQKPKKSSQVSKD